MRGSDFILRGRAVFLLRLHFQPGFTVHVDVLLPDHVVFYPEQAGFLGFDFYLHLMFHCYFTSFSWMNPELQTVYAVTLFPEFGGEHHSDPFVGTRA